MLIGEIDIHPIADGTFRASRAYFGAHARPDGHEDLFTRDRGGVAADRLFPRADR